jgi:hypothetical protein
VWFILPESLSRTQMDASAVKWKEQEENARNGNIGLLKRVFSLFSPLGIFVPQVVHSGSQSRRGKRDWNLTMLAIAFGAVNCIMVRHYGTDGKASVDIYDRARIRINCSMPPLNLGGPRKQCVMSLIILIDCSHCK